MKVIGKLLLLLVACTAKESFGGKISSCSKSSAKLQNIQMEFEPDYPQAGDVITVYLDGTLTDTVTEGHLQVELSHEKRPAPIKETFDLCYFLSLAKISCPLMSGKVHYRFRQSLPSTVISGNYTFRGVATQQNGQELFCLNAEFSIK
ncbi:putative phosphatidylglycerol/phosphatidylinositol transfer protein DDB_G0278295 [Dysidea avara]|uniref:putative phosphatidylglycerol/phosphatidylinositol transfer protein DDB_G0278295 n=1 Tax=Dysidea avara TaxID=196820 RepID=UPI00332532C6